MFWLTRIRIHVPRDPDSINQEIDVVVQNELDIMTIRKMYVALFSELPHYDEDVSGLAEVDFDIYPLNN